MSALSVERERHLLSCLDDVLDAPEADRSAVIRSRFGADPVLVRELERLLAAAAQSDPVFLEERAEIVVQPVLSDLETHSVSAAEVPAGFTRALAPRYSLLERIGSGGMATVYLAFDTALGRNVAIKSLRPELADGISRERFEREIEIAASIDHPRVVPVYDRGEADGRLFYVMRYVEGGSLRDLLLERPHLEIRKAIDIARDVAEALDAAHARNVVHRDIKPANILLDRHGALLADFGVARLIDAAGRERLTRTGLALGTAAYMSPEQVSSASQVDGRSDVYALACVLYEMLAGEAPFTGPTPREIVAKHLAAAIPDLTVVRATVTRPMQKVIATALQKAPADRFGSASEFIEAFERTWSVSGDTFSSEVSVPEHARATGRVDESTPGMLPAKLPRASTSAVPPGSASAPRTASRDSAVNQRHWIPLLSALVIVAAASGLLVQRNNPSAPTPDVARLTLTGDAMDPSLSPDGQRLAYTTVECDQGDKCTVNLVVKDLGGAGIATIARGLYAVNGTEWSHDGRYILVNTTTAQGKWGAFVVPTLGGDLRLLGCCQGRFIPGTDTVLLNAHRPGIDSVARVNLVLVSDGTVVDSFAIREPRGPLYVEPFAAGQLLVHSWHALERKYLVSLTDRHGRILDSLALPQNQRVNAQAWPNGNVILLTIRARNGVSVLVAHRVTPVGRIAERPDTLMRQLDATRFVPTQAGGLVYSAGTTSFDLVGLERENTLSSQFRQFRITSSTGYLRGIIDPTGTKIAISREPTPGSGLQQVSVRNFEIGPERVLVPPIELTGWTWSPDGNSILLLMSRGTDSTEVRSIEVASAKSTTLLVTQRLGWVWSPPNGGYWVLNVGADTMWLRDVPGRADTIVTRPATWMTWQTGSPSPDGRQFAFTTWDQKQDSLVMLSLSIDAGNVTQLASFSGQVNAHTSWLSDGTIVAQVQEQGTNALYRVVGENTPMRLGVLPRKGASVWLSASGLRAVMHATDTRNDIYFVRNFAKLLNQR